MARFLTLVSAVALSTLALSTPAFASEGNLFELQRDEGKPTSATLLDAQPADDVPRIMHQAMFGELEVAAMDSLESFDRQVRFSGTANDMAGGGDGSGGLALIAGILGFFPGFGIGHLITGNIGGFLLFLVVDLVIVGVFFVVFPLIAFTFWYVPSLIVILIERIVEAFSAANSATSGHYAEAEPSGAPLDHLPAAKAALQVFSF